jgi:hypothetical protein
MADPSATQPAADAGEIDFSEFKKKKKTKKTVAFDDELADAPAENANDSAAATQAAKDPSLDPVRPLEESADLTAKDDDLDFSDLKKVKLVDDSLGRWDEDTQVHSLPISYMQKKKKKAVALDLEDVATPPGEGSDAAKADE